MLNFYHHHHINQVTSPAGIISRGCFSSITAINLHVNVEPTHTEQFISITVLVCDVRLCCKHCVCDRLFLSLSQICKFMHHRSAESSINLYIALMLTNTTSFLSIPETITRHYYNCAQKQAYCYPANVWVLQTSV